MIIEIVTGRGFATTPELHDLLPFCLTYFDRRRPSVPLDTQFFDEHTNKLCAWITISQGGYHYFLTFNLLWSLLFRLSSLHIVVHCHG